jgi:hypothetical protein
MNNQPLFPPERAIPNPDLLRTLPQHDDDDDADWDDDDDDDIAAPRQVRWFSRAGFGSPEWWTH